MLGLIQAGGFGIMTLASLLGLVARRLRMRLHLGTQAETKTLGVVHRVVLGVVRVSLLVEAVVTVMLTWRFADGYGETWGRAGYLGVCHAVG